MNSNISDDAPAPSYTMGYGPEFQKMLARRSSAICAAHLLPHLRPGLRLLDLGCGPGTISVGLAVAVAPGELHGIDMEESQIEMARAAASAGGHENAEFRVGDATALPYEDASFDVVHCHAVLTHVPDTQAVLTEAKRVLKPGGLMSARELLGRAWFIEPEIGVEEAWEAFLKLLAANGGHPQIGKELKGAFVDAGFTNIRASASFESYGTADDVSFFVGLVNGWFFDPKTMGAAIQLGVADRDQFDAWRSALDEWSRLPGAFSALPWGEAIGHNP